VDDVARRGLTGSERLGGVGDLWRDGDQ
jgi:hypothetical protein